MPPVDRLNPIRAGSSDSTSSVKEFTREFPDDEACLQWLWRTRHAEDGLRATCPKCELRRPFHRVRGRPAWDCDYCGYHLHPTAGTIFEKSSTSLKLWFYAMFLMSQTSCEVSAKQLERELGVTYKTAWRMLHLIRNQLMDAPLRPSSAESATRRARRRPPARPRPQGERARGGSAGPRARSKRD